MTKHEALYNFFSGFGMPAYPVGSVPDQREVTYPYLTYDNITANRGEVAYPSVSMWFKTGSEQIPNDKVNEIMRIMAPGVSIPCDNGNIVCYCTEPWQAMADVEDDSIKRRVSTFTIMFNTL